MMRKEDKNKVRVCVQYDDHPRLMCTVLCSLMEHQSLVDLAIRCGNNTMHAHKCILAASSPYFREQLEKNPGTEQVIINGMDFSTMKSIMEFIYCGETNIVEEKLKYLVAAAKLFQIRGLQALADEANFEPGEIIEFPPPLFLNKKPKYSSTYLPFLPPPQPLDKNSNVLQSDCRRMKRKYVRSNTEADKRGAREANATCYALDELNKELGAENNCPSENNEQGMMNFVPPVVNIDAAANLLNDLNGIPLQVLNYSNINAPMPIQMPIQMPMPMPMPIPMEMQVPMFTTTEHINIPRNTVIPYEAGSDLEKFKDNFGHELPPNVEIMYKTPEGKFVNVTDELLRNITSDALQFQLIDENGREGEVQLLENKTKNEVAALNTTNKKNFEESLREYITTNAHTSTMANEVEEEVQKVDDSTSDENAMDIPSELNAMHYYDNTSYEDVAMQIEEACRQQMKKREAEIKSKKKKVVEILDNVVIAPATKKPPVEILGNVVIAPAKKKPS